MRRALVSLLVVAALAIGARPAAANGRFPRSIKIVFQPGDPQTALIGATFGAFITHDGGATWRWICELAIGFEGTWDPDFELTATGTLFATTPHGVRINRDGCVWSPPPGDVGTTQVSSLAVGGDGALYAGTSDVVAGSAVYKSSDDGATFAPTTLVGVAGDWWSSIEVAPSDPQKVIVTAYRMQAGFPRERLLFRSRDGGATWSPLPTTAFVARPSSDLYIAAIDRSDPDVVFLRLTNVGPTIEEAVYRTANFWTTDAAGPTWAKVLDQQDYITGVLPRAGGEVIASTPSLGLFRSTDGGVSFVPVPGVLFDSQCLAERPDGDLWMCTNNVPPDRATLHVSSTGAAGPWTKALAFADLIGPVRCPVGTPQRDSCEDLLWCGLKMNFVITSNEIVCDGAADAAPDASGDQPPKDTCCSTERRPDAMLAVVALGLLLRGRRRQRAGRDSR